MRLIYNCPDEDQTQNLAVALAEISAKGDVFALFGTLGMGKSVFARAFIKRLTNAPEVPSPTFTLVQTYEAPAFEIYHFDLYRLKDAEEIWELNMEEALNSAVCLIEWPEKMRSYLPSKAFKVNITADGSGGRCFEIDVPENTRERFLSAGRKPDALRQEQ